ncbi:MAG: pyrroline-5-carboxylate reductase [Parasphingorhabdus sp.]|jgi:pyrroline-5-carboxylate reductase|tara:strand:- start:3011 stop:3844 length:834 start_codon:yes stop_codon:yes gene_type:complete
MSSIAFIGGGNMASCIIGGMIANGFSAQDIIVSEPGEQSRLRLEDTYGLTTLTDNQAAAKQADLIVLAVKPQIMRSVAIDLAPALGANSVVVSIAAGIPLRALQTWLGAYTAIVRAMPNTPAMLLEGATGLFANQHVDPTKRDLVTTIFQAIGYACWVETEAQIDAVIAVSGSGPAYFFRIIEIMQKVGQELGLPEQIARELSLQTALGSARMATESGTGAGQLREQVTSPGGTTQAALNTFEQLGLEATFREAMRSALNRAEEMAIDFSAQHELGN